MKKEIKDGIKRADALRTYKSNLRLFEDFFKDKIKFILEFKKINIVNYLDYLYNTRNNSSRTYNNQISFLTLFFNWYIEKSYIKDNPTKGIVRKKNVQKKRTIIDDRITEIFEYLNNLNFGYYTICMIIYFCFIRKTEITKLKVKDVDLDKNIIFVSGEISKNGKSEIVTIPAALKIILEKHLKDANKNVFLFSQNNYAPGLVQLKPKKISDEWVKVRKALSLPNTMQFYSLKDSGITDMFNAGIPNIKIRDQARHHDIKMTETYTQRNKKADEDILNFK